MARLSDRGFWSAVYRVFHFSRNMAVVVALAVSLAANATLVVGSVLSSVVDDFLADVTGLQTASAKQRKAIRSLQKENRQLREKTEKIVKRVRRRVVRSAVRTVGTLSGKAFPGVGIAVSVGVTALDIKDFCDTIRDMNSVSRYIDPSEAADDSETTVCSMRLPTAEEIRTQLTTISPQEVWEKSKNFVPDLNLLTDTTVSSTELWQDTKSFLGSHWNELYSWRHEDKSGDN